MATEMILVPKTRYEKMASDDKEYHNKLGYYTTLLRDNGIDFNDQSDITDNAIDSDSMNKQQSSKPPVKADNDVGGNEMVEKVESSSSSKSEDYVNSSLRGQSPMDIVTQLPEKYRLYGKRLLAYINKNGKNILGWTASGLLIYRGVDIAKTDIIALVSHIFKSNTQPPNGIKQFKKALKEIRTPKVFLKPFLLTPPGIPNKIKKNWTTY